MNNKTQQHKYIEQEILSIGCLVCIEIGTWSPAEPHHYRKLVTSKKRKKAPIIPLCHNHHNAGKYGISVHAGEKEFEKQYGKQSDMLIRLDAILIQKYGDR